MYSHVPLNGIAEFALLLRHRHRNSSDVHSAPRLAPNVYDQVPLSRIAPMLDGFIRVFLLFIRSPVTTHLLQDQVF